MVDFKYDGGGIGKGATVTITVDDKPVARGPRRAVRCRSAMSLDETLDIGEDTGTPVSEDYQVPFKFTGDLKRVLIGLTDAKLTAADERDPPRARRGAVEVTVCAPAVAGRRGGARANGGGGATPARVPAPDRRTPAARAVHWSKIAPKRRRRRPVSALRSNGLTAGREVATCLRTGLSTSFMLAPAAVCALLGSFLIAGVVSCGAQDRERRRARRIARNRPPPRPRRERAPPGPA